MLDEKSDTPIVLPAADNWEVELDFFPIPPGPPVPSMSLALPPGVLPKPPALPRCFSLSKTSIEKLTAVSLRLPSAKD